MDEQLIDLVSHHEVIYNVKSEQYRDAGLRNLAWEDIAQQHGKSVEECKEDWNKLRNCYNNAIKRRQKKYRIGKRIPPWRFESQMSFLFPHLQGKITECIPTEEEDTSPGGNAVKYSPAPSCSSPAEKRKPSECDYMEPIQYANVMDTSDRLQSDFDDTDHFFLSMSRMVKKLPRVDQIRIQMDLHKAIFDVEMRQLEAEKLVTTQPRK